MLNATDGRAPLDSDTIAAIATPPGRGGIGILRLSGPEALRIAQGIVQTKRPLEPARVRYGVVLDAERRRLDDALVTFFPSPKSYTGEDVVEISTHGSPVVLGWLLNETLRLGARLARPGEFTERAFLRGRIDLTAAEAVRDLIEAQTLGQARLAAEQIAGSLAGKVRPYKEELIGLVSALEAGIDFAEDDIDTLPFQTIQIRIASLLLPLEALLATFAYGRILRGGLRLAIVGRPNAGKSSLFNCLVQRNRAIVTANPGTTRDVIAEQVSLDGIPVELLDTAGLRETEDEIEQIGMARTREAIAEADMVLVVIDAAGTHEATGAAHLDDATTSLLRGRPVLQVHNKIDLLKSGVDTRQQHPPPFVHGAIRTSALTGEGIASLRAAILNTLGAGSSAATGQAILTDTRHRDSVARTVAALQHAELSTHSATPHEMLLLDLYEALAALDELTGQTVPDTILDRIFSTFCIGK